MRRKKILVTVNDSIQKRYRYMLVEPRGKNFHPEFTPDLTPQQMLRLGVFGGFYLNDCKKEFPASWFKHAKLSQQHNQQCNYFKINASQPLAVWQKREWIHPLDPRGWFQWYCRYWRGRRMPEEDLRQIKRWKAIRRHAAQLKKHCRTRDLTCRPRQRQALLHWAYDSRKI